MNLDNLKPTWEHYKTINGLDEIQESEILSSTKPKKKGFNIRFTGRIAQNAFIFSFLILTLSGGCSI